MLKLKVLQNLNPSSKAVCMSTFSCKLGNITEFCSCYMVSIFYPMNFNIDDLNNEGNKDCPID